MTGVPDTVQPLDTLTEVQLSQVGDDDVDHQPGLGTRYGIEGSQLLLAEAPFQFLVPATDIHYLLGNGGEQT